MPIYEYECEVCRHRTETLQKISDPPLTKCSKCNGPVRKVISPAGLHFKGSGFYITDYTNKNGKSPSETKSDGKNEGKKEKSEPAKKKTPIKSNKTSKDQ